MNARTKDLNAQAEIIRRSALCYGARAMKLRREIARDTSLLADKIQEARENEVRIEQCRRDLRRLIESNS